MEAAEIARVAVEKAPYNVYIQPNGLSQIGQLLTELGLCRSAAIITDSHVSELHAKALPPSLEAAGFKSIMAVVPAGEIYKTLQHLLPVYDLLLSSRLERSTPILALGGGVIGDMAGFVAATVLRGVPLIQIPTTLLAMVDASVGGKTGVDHVAGKNLIGAFYQPKAVLIDPNTLTTLPPRELRNGLAECIKHDLIRDAGHFEQMGEILPKALQLDIPTLTKLIAHNIAIKARVVEADPFEKGERAHLNLGHTFGHALETVSNFEYAHGEAVSLGITAAAYVSHKLGMLDPASLQRVVASLNLARLPTHGLQLPTDAIVEAMQFDKKNKDGKVRFVLLDGIGKAVVRDDVPPPLVREAIESLRGG